MSFIPHFQEFSKSFGTRLWNLYSILWDDLLKETWMAFSGWACTIDASWNLISYIVRISQDKEWVINLIYVNDGFSDFKLTKFFDCLHISQIVYTSLNKLGHLKDQVIEEFWHVSLPEGATNRNNLTHRCCHSCFCHLNLKMTKNFVWQKINYH